MGLILKWREMREKMKHYRRHVRIRNSTVCGQTYLQVLDKVVEYTQTLRVLTVRDVHERTNLGSLPGSCETGKKYDYDQMAYLERDMLIPDPDFKLLLPDNILLRPIRVILPTRQSACAPSHRASK